MVLSQFGRAIYTKSMQVSASNTQANRSLITRAQASRSQRGIALILCSIGIILFPFAHIQGPVVLAFLPTYTTFALFANLLTAFFLLGEFFSSRLRSLAVLGATYLFCSIIIILYACTFPGIYSATGLFGAGSQTAIWLWLIWHTVFPSGIFLYTILEHKYGTQQLSIHAGTRLIRLLLLLILLLIILLCIWTLGFAENLPIVIEGETYTKIRTIGVGPIIWTINGIACFGTFRLLHQRTILHIWLRAAASTSLLSVLLSDYAGARFSAGWYFSRVNSALAAASLLCALFFEVSRLYKQLAKRNDELATQQELQKSFVAVVSHEFRTALTSIEGFSELLHTQDFSSHEVKEFTGDMNADAKRLSRMITNILDLEGMQTGSIALSLQTIDLKAILCSVISHAQILGTSHQFLLDLAPSLPLIQADPDKITQVFTNLITNAIKYSPQGGNIHIIGQQEGKTVHLIIRDQGRGIPADQLELIFERYMRIEASHSRHITGTGLGLSIVRQIIEMHRGSIWTKSTLQQGSDFHILLPLSQKPTQ